MSVPSGFLGNLSSEQETKLQQLWTIVLKAADSTGAVPQGASHSRTESNVSVKSNGTATSVAPGPLSDSLKAIGMNSTDIKAVQQSLEELSPDQLRTGLLETVKHENPDALLLRFLRARKWDVAKSLAMMMASISWRIKEMHVDDEVLAKGELHALEQSKQKANPTEAKDGNAFLAQMRMGKSYNHGVDKTGRPIVVIRVQLHKPGEQSEEVLNQYIVHVIESVRLTLVPPVETACVVFDMTGFSLSNMEYPPVKFIIKCFEANYPESLGVLLIHNAPWIFSGIWRLIKGWMDPNIVAKINFTKNTKDLEQFISKDNIVKQLGGNENWEYEYIEPSVSENDRMQDTATRDSILAERQKIGEELLRVTGSWIAAANSKDKAATAEYKKERDDVIEQLRKNYWALDPYVRARNYLDRTNVIQDGGKISYYPSAESVGSNGLNKALEVEADRRQAETVN